MSRCLNEDEVREHFLNHIWDLVRYWKDSKSERSNVSDKLEGLAFSILSTLDGCSIELPSFIVAPLPHEDDKEYNIENGLNYYPENHEVNINADIAGVLHDSFYNVQQNANFINPIFLYKFDNTCDVWSRKKLSQ